MMGRCRMGWEEVALVVVWTVCWLMPVWMNRIEQVYKTDCARTKTGNEARIVRGEHWRASVIQKVCVV